MFKLQWKGFIAGVLTTSMITTSLFTFAGGVLKTLEVAENSINILINGKKLDTTTYVIDGRTYLGLRSIGEAFGKDVGWDGNTNTVSINDKVNSANVIPNKDIEDIKSQSQANDPKGQFVQHINEFLFKDYDYKSQEPIQTGNGLWYKKQYRVDKEFSYDIQKTDSLVSPYTAILNFMTYEDRTVEYKTKEEAKKDNTFQPFLDTTADKLLNPFYKAQHKYHYAYQDGKWVFKSSEYLYPLFDNEWSVSDSANELHCFGFLAKF